MPDFSKQLSRYLPDRAAPIVSAWINDTGCRFRVSKARKTKLGDYRAPFRGSPHQISINHDLNPYSFLITTVHEFAHLKTWNQHQHNVKPHGMEWKANFKKLMHPFFAMDILPPDIHAALIRYLENPAASSCTDLTLYTTLRKYNQGHDLPMDTVTDLAENAYFKLPNGRVFQKMARLRKRYKCREVATGRIYLFHPVAEVTALAQSDGPQELR